jgi:hypothetical protein
MDAAWAQEADANPRNSASDAGRRSLEINAVLD